MRLSRLFTYLSGVAGVSLLFRQFPRIQKRYLNSMPSEGKYSMIYCSAPSEDVGRTIANALVEKRLAACVNVIPHIQSTYLWKGKVVEDKEYLMLIKTREDAIPSVTEAIAALHTYDTPEIIAVPIIGGSKVIIIKHFANEARERDASRNQVVQKCTAA